MRLPYSLALISLAACIDPPEQGPELETIEATCQGCKFGNGPLVGGHPFSWIPLDGTESNEGVTFLEFRKGKALSLDVNKNVLRFRDQYGLERGYKDLEGAVIRVSIKNEKYDIRIAAVHNCYSAYSTHSVCTDHGIPYWTDVPSGEAETYDLGWFKVNPQPGDQPEDLKGSVCPYDDVEELNGGHLKEALVFEGDSYDPITRSITETDTETKFRTPFNIACMGSLPAKMELARRTYATQDSNYETTIDNDRQALARAWAAQYCNNEVFTKTGHLLRIMDKRGWLHHDGWGWHPRTALGNPKFTYEAVWNSRGAVCVEKPRLEVPDPLGAFDDGAIWKLMRATCPKNTPPRCSTLPWFPDRWADHGQFITANIAWEKPSVAVPLSPPVFTSP